MKILSITAGAGNMYCGSCLRDNNLAAALRRQGHDVILLPLYTPTRTDEANASRPGRIFFGGISVYLEQLSPLFRRTPKFLDKLWDLPAVISLFAGRGVEVDPKPLGALTVSILEGVAGHQRKEIDSLVEWLRHEPMPDLITLPYTLLISLGKPLKQLTGCPIVCTLQGEELFIEGLIEPYRTRALELIREQVPEVDGFIAVSEYGARFMTGYLGIPPGKLFTVPLGIPLEGHSLQRRTRNPHRVIGFLGRIAPEKGLHLLAEAYKLLRDRPDAGPLRLEAAGYLPPERKTYLASVEAKFKAWGIPGEFRYWGEVTRDQKTRFLQNADVFSMPATYDEPKGLSILEAMANGVPVVQPRRGSFVEMVENTGGGLLVEPDSPEALAGGLWRILSDPSLALDLGRRGAEGVRRDYSVDRMAASTAEVYRQVSRNSAPQREKRGDGEASQCLSNA
jgi:glycosyltransferase involved in cell wall biosynthesis